MYKLIAAFIFLIFSQAALAQSREERVVDPFDKIKAGQAIKVYLHKSEEEKIIIEASDVNFDDIEARVENQILILGLSGNRFFRGKVKIDVYYKTLKALYASSASTVFGEDVIESEEFDIDVSSAASVDVELNVDRINVEASSASDVKLSGKTKELYVDVSSAGGVDAYALTTGTAEIEASSAGSVKINVRNELTADASSGGSIRYKGNPERTNTNSSSGGSVRKD